MDLLFIALNLSWVLVATGGGYLAYVSGRRREHDLWVRWYDAEQVIVQADRKRQEEKRSVTLTTVQFRRD